MLRHFLCIALVASSLFAQAQQSITLEDIYKKGTFRVKSVPGFTALKDGRRYTQLDPKDGSSDIRVYDLASGKPGEFVFQAGRHPISGKPLTIESYAWSEDESRLLLFTENEPVYRRSSLQRVYVYDRNLGTIVPVHSDKVMHATFSPDGLKVAYVYQNNIYYKDLVTREVVAVTTDGRKNEIINGNADWVYEEEFSISKAFFWSPDSKYLAYYRFDERRVPEFTMTLFDSLYPTPYQYKYPKAGEANSVVDIFVYHLKSKALALCELPEGRSGKDYYIPRIQWTKSAHQLCILKLNRHQNHLQFLFADAKSGKTRKVFDERNKWYIDINDDLTFLPDRESFVFSSERSGFNHFYRYNWKHEELTALTKGNYDVDALVGVDEQKGVVYYTAAVNPLERRLYSVDLDGEGRRLLTPEAGTHQITRIEGFRYFLDKYSTLNRPPVYYLRDRNGDIVRTLEDNKQLVETMRSFKLGRVRLQQIPGEKGVPLHAWMMTPPDFEKTRKYPVLMYQYSGPGSQEVADRFPIRDYFWHQMLAEKGYIIVCVDGTGTGFRGERFKKRTYQQLGNLESKDQMAAARYLSTLPYVDAGRIGIWGWSYGGFMAATCLFKGGSLFKAGIAVAPVTNWRYYDNIYTERYMRTPQENPEGYDKNAPEQMAAGLTGSFLLVHGTADDNVHVQNAMTLTDALIKADKTFDSEMYPNRNHGIYGGNTRLHLYRRMTDFILKNL